MERIVEAGLTSEQAASLLAVHGPNRLPVQRAKPAWRRLAAEMVHFFAVLFWVAGVLAFVAGLPQLGIAIFVVIVLNGVFAFAQEERAEHAAEGLRQMMPRRATVIRDGVPQQIPAEEMVVGDSGSRTYARPLRTIRRRRRRRRRVDPGSAHRGRALQAFPERHRQR